MLSMQQQLHTLKQALVEKDVNVKQYVPTQFCTDAVDGQVRTTT